jgi:signal transduction histidine kinase
MMQRVMGDLTLLAGTVPSALPVTAAEPVEVALLIRRTLRIIPSVASRTAIDSPGGLAVRGDPIRLRQCLLLVLGNAEKYAPHGKITVTARAHGGYGVISIADEGPGIPAAERPLALKPYYRSPSTGAVPGSGIGLHLADVMLTAMGGRIELGDAPSGGLEASLWLPLTDEAAVR